MDESLPNEVRYHQIATVPMAPIDPKPTSKLRSALHFRYSVVIEAGLGILSIYIILLLENYIQYNTFFESFGETLVGWTMSYKINRYWYNNEYSLFDTLIACFYLFIYVHALSVNKIIRKVYGYGSVHIEEQTNVHVKVIKWKTFFYTCLILNLLMYKSLLCMYEVHCLQVYVCIILFQLDDNTIAIIVNKSITLCCFECNYNYFCIIYI